MNYVYCCGACEHEFEVFNIPMANRADATKQPCPRCGKKKVGQKLTAPSVTHGGSKTVFQRAGDGWKDVQNKIKSHSGRNNTIRTK